jgi:hypothetical protein
VANKVTVSASGSGRIDNITTMATAPIEPSDVIETAEAETQAKSL